MDEAAKVADACPLSQHSGARPVSKKSDMHVLSIHIKAHEFWLKCDIHIRKKSI